MRFHARCLIQGLGFFLPRVNHSLWLQGESLDQFVWAAGLIDLLRLELPQFRVLFSSRDPLVVGWLKRKYGSDTTCRSPASLAWTARRFAGCLNPRVIICIGSFDGCLKANAEIARIRGVPMIAVNLSREATRLLKDSGHLGGIKEEVALWCVQDGDVASALVESGIDGGRVAVTGNLAMDYTPKSMGTERRFLGRELGIVGADPVIIAENMPPPEEDMLLKALDELRGSRPGMVALLEPRHPGRACRVARRFERAGFSVAVRSRGPCRRKPDILVFDRPGELEAFYPLAALVILGGSFSAEPHPDHAVIPAALGVPCVAGGSGHGGSDRDPVSLIARHEGVVQTGTPLRGEALTELLNTPELLHRIGQNAENTLRDRRGATMRTFECVRQHLPRAASEPPVVQSWRLKTARDRLGESPFWRAAAALLARNRMDEWESLKRFLGCPRTILCLGNGPSSEDPRALKAQHDCLMRVNWRWKRRGFLAKPDVVFVGDPQTMTRVSGCVFGFWNISLEYGMLLRRFLTRGPAPVTYFTMERISSVIRDRKWPARPTNGALMIVAAAALEPARLIVSGMDLYLHSNGRYPGDVVAENRYAQAHRIEVELQIIEEGLKRYEGELVILSETLASFLKR